VARAWGELAVNRLSWVNIAKRFLSGFTEHPASVGETYMEHARQSFQFGISMACGSAAACVHALIPSLCTSTGSRIIARFHQRMILNRMRLKVLAQGNAAGENYFAEHI
jgi:hypothetical protein